jgi:hypothetical protein
LNWKTVESNSRGVVREISKIDNFNGRSAPLLRFRATIHGPCLGEYLAEFMTSLKRRQLWDPQIEQIYEVHAMHDLDEANIAMLKNGQYAGRLGDCSRLGVGYCQTKGNFCVSAREQLTLCGIQDFTDGSAIIWGTEMEDWHNHLFPPGPRHTRAKSHLFATTITPTSEQSFDAEYVLQLDIGGKIPTWMTAPIVTETVKSMFHTADQYFRGKEGDMEAFLRKKRETDDLANRSHGLLMTP